MIKFDQFRSDYDYWNEEMVSAWDEWQWIIAHNNSVRSATCSSTKDCDERCVRSTRECETAPKTGRRKCRTVCLEYKYYGYTCTARPAWNGQYGPADAGSWCSTDGSPYISTSSASNAYYNAKSNRDRALEQIKQCNDWWRDYNYFNPRVYLDYEEQMYGVNKLELQQLTTESRYRLYYVGSSSRKNSWLRQSTTTKNTCGSTGRYCSTGSITYPTNENVSFHITKTIQYVLPDNLYHYVQKPSGLSVSQKPTQGEYVALSYSNLPVHYSRLEGLYNLSLTVTTFGPNNKFDQYVFRGVSFNGNGSVKCNGLYKCNYRVINDFIECESGEKCEKLTAVFRVISLTNPFPGIKGTGRTAGSNWRDYETLITNNRGLSDPEKIFTDREPMYQITLTTRLILSIRSYNRSQQDGYGNFKMSCIKGTGEECKSSFIREKFASYFTGCTMSNNWNACR